MNYKRLLAIKLSILLMITIPFTAAHAQFVMSGVSYTANSVSFMMTGDGSGYASFDYVSEWSMVYGGDLWSGGNTSQPSTITGSIFSNDPITIQYTGGFELTNNYTWGYFTNVTSATLGSGTLVTIFLGANDLNVNATNPDFLFVQGNGNQPEDYMLLAQARPGANAPEPASIALVSMGFLGFAASRRKKNPA